MTSIPLGGWPCPSRTFAPHVIGSGGERRLTPAEVRIHWAHAANEQEKRRGGDQLPGGPYHLEFTQHDPGSPGPAPSRDNLLVLYFDDPAQVEQAAARLAALGHPRVEAENPYWTENGAVTVEDPDHWRVVLMLLAAEGVTTVQVATAAADIGNLRFYQRQGFRMHSIERDAFTESSGYPAGCQVARIPLRWPTGMADHPSSAVKLLTKRFRWSL